eukprot:TRINITY_DN6524_c0_g3_i1.p1 TRINITY_DN6524_c0_g3~~TRINITY_DN6524_c0_g3_i1.p1  ORF type:complete len:234 (+),score=40.03 TRINITY_DN6524_c0_g3_i1:23-703(+)
MMQSVLDPTAIFCFFCILIPMYKEPETTDADRVAFLSDPAFFCPLLVIMLAALVTRGQGVKVDDKRARARWYLWNAGVIHGMMDGLVGAFGQLPIFAKQYAILDKRFGNGEVTVPVVVGMLEIFIWAPLCLLTYNAIRRGLPSAAPLELITSTCHIVGTIAFITPEFLEGFPNIVTDFNFEFTLHHIVYFWFGFLVNFLWIFLPLYLMVEPYNTCCAALSKHQKTE